MQLEISREGERFSNSFKLVKWIWCVDQQKVICVYQPDLTEKSNYFM